jgi:streptogramin lyase
VYAQPVDQTLNKLQTLGFDLSSVRSDTWQGRPVYVVGAKAGDVHSRQFWVDKQRLVFVRMLEPGQRDTSITSETQFNDYRAFGSGWVSAQVLFLNKGQRVWMEEYDQIQVDVPLTDGAFDAHRWKTTK